jgi:rhodanese-related sulfurtransferase/predicted transcriptional regulator
MSTESPKRTLFRSLAHLAQACAHEHRLELLELMAQGEQSVEALAQRTGLSVANTSQHLQLLRRAGLADTRRSGRHVFYTLADDVGIVQLLEQLRTVAERQLAEVQRLLGQHLHVLDGFEPVDADTLMGLLDEQAVTLIDVRPEDEYLNGHVAGARNVPHDAIDRHVEFLPRDRPIVAYCRGPYCVMAFNAVARLRALGFDVQRFATGYPQWKASGLPVERGPSPRAVPARRTSSG